MTDANRRRRRRRRGKRLLRHRGKKPECTFAHLLATGGLRRVQANGLEEIRKWMLLHAAIFNLGFLIRKYFGLGTPSSMQGLATSLAI